MRAILMDRYGGPDVLRLGEAPMPVPTGSRLLIKVAASGVNPADGKWRAGLFAAFAPLRWPHILGYDVAGTVVGGPGAIGRLAPGTRVAAALDPLRAGGYADTVAADASQVAAIPDGMAPARAAAVPTPGLTGVQLIEQALDVQPGERVLITGATGAVGRFAVAAALARGAIVVAAVRRSQVGQALLLGASSAIVLGEEAWAGPPLDKVADMIGGAAVAALCRHVPAAGRIGTVATTPIPTDGLAVQPIVVRVHADAARLTALLAAVAADRQTLPPLVILPLEAAAEAQRRLEAGTAGGKIVLLP